MGGARWWCRGCKGGCCGVRGAVGAGVVVWGVRGGGEGGTGAGVVEWCKGCGGSGGEQGRVLWCGVMGAGWRRGSMGGCCGVVWSAGWCCGVRGEGVWSGARAGVV